MHYRDGCILLFLLLVFFLFQPENCFEFLRDSRDRCLGSKMHSFMQSVNRKNRSMVGNSSANTTLSFYRPNPSLSLESALRHTAKASCNLEHMEEGRKSKGERDATMQKALRRGQDVAPLFSGSPSFSFQHHSRTVLSPQAACLK